MGECPFEIQIFKWAVLPAYTSLAITPVIRDMADVETSKSYISRICSSISDMLISLI